jgi:2-keto-4-pentenoate hydratase/2-oxohepta-3-ene-1,7-dioic acid hydratase in catechol pathway
MKRRNFVAGVLLAATIPHAQAQQHSKVYRLAIAAPCGPNDPIVLPDLPDREIHHECELAIIIGKGGRSISRHSMPRPISNRASQKAS